MKITVTENPNMIYTITVKTTFDSEADADAFLDAIQNLDEENMFPNGAEVRRDTDHTPQAYPPCCLRHNLPVWARKEIWSAV